MIVHILTSGFNNPNGCAFLFPLIVHRNALQNSSIHCQFFFNVEPGLWDCDALIVENKFFGSRWGSDLDGVLGQLGQFKDKVKKVFYFDITDSSGWDHAYALPYVTAYLKNQLLVDKNKYLKPMYGYRIFSDYYHNKDLVVDKNEGYSIPVNKPVLLDKLGLGWNSGLADWSLWGPFKMGVYRRTKFSSLLSYPNQPKFKCNNRTKDISCRYGHNYARDTIAWQRKKLTQIMSDLLSTNKLNRRQYFKELEMSKIIVSPFGLGEITLKDFEVFLTGGLLFKPDMNHMETWPNFFVQDETMVCHSWELTDFRRRLGEILAHYDDYIYIANEGQRRYMEYTYGERAAELFIEHFLSILTKNWGAG